jgi:F-type H+-transporting ATPase subunit epsilon
MVDAAEWPAEIDRERAKAAKERAEEILASRTLKFETANAANSLKRAVFRLKAWELRQDPQNPEAPVPDSPGAHQGL